MTVPRTLRRLKAPDHAVLLLLMSSTPTAGIQLADVS
jgi:hypothetical protein